jgi:Glycosyltransferase family 87
MKRSRRTALFLILLSCGLSVLWGSFIAHSYASGGTDFELVFYGSRCLIDHTDPYRGADILTAYLGDGQRIPTEPMMANLFRHAVLVSVNLPTTLFFVIPFAWMPLHSAYLLWTLTMTVGLALSSFLIWDLAAAKSSSIALLLVCVLCANCVILFANGNTACIVISLCVIAVWCFLQDRFVLAGLVCLAFGLAIKPHDAGLVWLYFLLAGGVYRKRAWQTLTVAIAICLPAVFWVSHIVPNWLPELRANLYMAGEPGGLSDPRPTAIGFHQPDAIISLQTVISVFCDDPRIYIPISLLVAGALVLLWIVVTLRSQASERNAWIALAAIAPLTMLVTYHRQHDAKLLLLTIPACALIWSERGVAGWLALLTNSAAILITSDIPATYLSIVTSHQSVGAGFFGELKAALLVRPIPIVLLLVTCFYLWVYMKQISRKQISSTQAVGLGMQI